MVTPGGLVVLTDRRSAAGPLVEVVEAAVRGGAGWVILRERDLGYAERAALAAQLRSLLPPGRLIVAGPDPLGGTAVHLAGADPLPTGIPLVGRSWHGIEEVSGVDYVTVSPVYPTSSKPGYGPALGATGAAEMRAPVPWLALGGVDSASRAAACAAAGAAGIAVLGAIMRAPDPAAVAHELASAFESAAAVPAGSERCDAGGLTALRASPVGAVAGSGGCCVDGSAALGASRGGGW